MTLRSLVGLALAVVLVVFVATDHQLSEARGHLTPRLTASERIEFWMPYGVMQVIVLEELRKQSPSPP